MGLGVVLGAWRLAGVEWSALFVALAAFGLAAYAVRQNVALRREFKRTMTTQATVAEELKDAVANGT